MERKRIIFIDDEDFLYSSLIESLRDAHDVVVENRDATMALMALGVTKLNLTTVDKDSNAQRPPYSLVILDLMMPPGSEGTVGGLLAGATELDAGLFVYRLMRQGQVPGLEWAMEAKVFVLTADNTRKTRDEVLAVSGTREDDNVEIHYKPTDRLFEKILEFADRGIGG